MLTIKKILILSFILLYPTCVFKYAASMQLDEPTDIISQEEIRLLCDDEIFEPHNKFIRDFLNGLNEERLIVQDKICTKSEVFGGIIRAKISSNSVDDFGWTLIVWENQSEGLKFSFKS